MSANLADQDGLFDGFEQFTVDDLLTLAGGEDTGLSDRIVDSYAWSNRKFRRTGKEINLTVCSSYLKCGKAESPSTVKQCRMCYGKTYLQALS